MYCPHSQFSSLPTSTIVTMSGSEGSASRTNDGSGSDTFAGGSKTTSSKTGSASNRVMVEEYYPRDSQESICLLPEHTNSSLQGQRCTMKVYCVDTDSQSFGESSSTTAELSALLAEIDKDGKYIVELRCDLGKNNPRKVPCFRFHFEDQVRKVQLLPLPLKTAFQFDREYQSSGSGLQTLGALLVVVSKRGGLSIHSIVFSRTSDDEPFRITEFKKVSRGCIEETGDFMEVSLFLDSGDDARDVSKEGIDPVLYAGILSTSSSTRSHRLDVLGCPLVCHKSPLFQFTTKGPTRALKRSLVLTGSGSTKGISVSSRRVGNLSYCTVACLFDSELKVIRLPSLEKWTKEALKLEDILVVPLDEPSVGHPSVVFHLRGPETSQHIAFLVACQQRKPKNTLDHLNTPILSPMTLEAETIAAFPGKDVPPPQWTVAATRNAVRRARREVLADVVDSLRVEDRRKRSMITPQPCYDMVSPSDLSSQDENLDISIESPETAMLDMGGKWMKTSTSDSISSPLAGLTFAGADDSMTLASSLGNDEKSDISKQSRSSLQRPSSNAQVDDVSRNVKLILVLIPAKDEMSPTDPVVTDILPMPDRFPRSFAALWVHEMENEIALAAVPTGSSMASILVVPFHRGRLNPSASAFTAPPTEVSLPDVAILKAVDFEFNRPGSPALRATIAKTRNVFQGQEGSSIELCEHVVRFKSFKLPLSQVSDDDLSPSQPLKKRKGNDDTSLISEKLDNIMKTLQKFESNVNEKLNILERREAENARRISRLETSLNFRYSRAEF